MPSQLKRRSAYSYAGTATPSRRGLRTHGNTETHIRSTDRSPKMVNIRKDHQNVSRWQAMSPEQRARRMESIRAWQAANKDRIRETNRKRYRAKNPQVRQGYARYEAAAKYDHVRDAKIKVGECIDCGFPCDDVTHVCFAWDHIDPSTKSFSLSKAPNRTWDEIDAEIDKCELVCHNCHAIRTYLERHNRTERRQLTDETQPTLFD